GLVMKSNSSVMFAGTDSAGGEGLWFTNGTAAGTYELTGIEGANAAGGLFGGPTGFVPDFTSFNGEVLFRGIDANGELGLGVYAITGLPPLASSDEERLAIALAKIGWLHAELRLQRAQDEIKQMLRRCDKIEHLLFLATP